MKLRQKNFATSVMNYVLFKCWKFSEISKWHDLRKDSLDNVWYNIRHNLLPKLLKESPNCIRKRANIFSAPVALEKRAVH